MENQTYEMMDVNELVAYELNNKEHKDEDIGKIMESIETVGMRAPIEIDENNVILAWHGRAEACKRLGITQVPVLRYTDMTESQKKLYRHFANRTADFAEYDKEAIRQEIMNSTEDEKLTLEKLYEEFKIRLDNEKDLAEEDVAPMPSLEWQTIVQFGDVFELYDWNMIHTLVCGDSTDDKRYCQLNDNQSVVADALVTDPPYNVNYKGRGKKTSKGIANDNLENDNFQFFLDDAYRLINEHTKSDSAWYTYHWWEREECFKGTISKYSTIKAQIVRNKTIYNHVGGSYKRKHELCFYSIKGEEKFYGDTIFQADVEEIDRDTITPEKLMSIIKANKEAEKHGMTSIWTEKRENTQLYIHPTQKPVRLIEKMILNSSLIGQTILDPFLWSWTTLISCQKNNRNCYGIEMSPWYIEAIIVRWLQYTDKINKKWEIQDNTLCFKCKNRDINLQDIIKNVLFPDQNTDSTDTENEISDDEERE